MEYIIIFGIVIIIILLLLLIKQSSTVDNSNTLKELNERLISFESTLRAKLDSQPEIIKSGISEELQKSFNIFTDYNQKNARELIEEFGKLRIDLTKNLSESSKVINNDISVFKDRILKSMNEDFKELNKLVETKLDNINSKVQENLSEGFNKTNETFTKVLQRLVKIDEAQKKIEELSTDIGSLQDILTDKKSRGTFGEVQLNQVLYSVFGEKSDKIYKIQHQFSTGVTADAVLFAPEPTGTIAIDSKFPLENYRRMTDKELTEIERNTAAKSFESDLKKHISDISDKYIIHGETADQAILFLPAEAIFAEIHAYHENIVDFSRKKRVWLTSPTTFLAVLSTLQIVVNNLERRKFADIIQQEIENLSIEFNRYIERWNNLSRHIDTVQKDVKDIHTTTDKISKKFTKISRVKLDKGETNDQELLNN